MEHINYSINQNACRVIYDKYLYLNQIKKEQHELSPNEMEIYNNYNYELTPRTSNIGNDERLELIFMKLGDYIKDNESRKYYYRHNINRDNVFRAVINLLYGSLFDDTRNNYWILLNGLVSSDKKIIENIKDDVKTIRDIKNNPQNKIENEYNKITTYEKLYENVFNGIFATDVEINSWVEFTQYLSKKYGDDYKDIIFFPEPDENVDYLHDVDNLNLYRRRIDYNKEHNLLGTYINVKGGFSNNMYIMYAVYIILIITIIYLIYLIYNMYYLDDVRCRYLDDVSFG